MRDTRPNVAARKAEIALQLGVLCRRAPRRVVNGSVQQVGNWREAQAHALKLLASKTASVHQLQCALNALQRFE